MSALRQETEGSSIEGVIVFVREYLRYRLGKWEAVKSHLRRWPRSGGTTS
jgi:hypothetical protein